MSQKLQHQKANQFSALHQKGNPLVLFNAWDSGSAKTVASSDAQAIATGSWSVAASFGFDDGEKLPLTFVLDNAKRIVESVILPVTLDFETAYAPDLNVLREHISSVIQCGVVGINFEDQNYSTGALNNVEQQCERIEAARDAADKAGIALFINARTDIFLNADVATHNATQLDEAITRAVAYAKAGANGFFAPALCEPAFIRQLCQASPLPINIMMMPQISGVAQLAELGVARVSYGPAPYRLAMAALKQAATSAHQWKNMQ